MTVTACMLAAVLVLSNAAQIGAAVFCVGSDGHVDIESAVCACCTLTVSHDERVRSGLVPASPSCSDCVDVPLRMLSFKPKGTQFSAPLIFAEWCPLALNWGGGSRTALFVLGNQIDQHWQSLSSLSTVVLLT